LILAITVDTTTVNCIIWRRNISLFFNFSVQPPLQ
jgi:hypothetical protein